MSRLINASLGRLGRGMAAVPEPLVDEAMPNAPSVEVEVSKPAATAAAATTTPMQAPAQGSGGGKKKKKGKK